MSLDRWEAEASEILPEGPNVVTNTRKESHLVGNSPETGSLALQAFLQEIVTRFREAGAKKAFQEAALSHLLEGRLLASNPTTLRRFRPMDRFGESVARANGEIPEWKRNSDDYITSLLENWDTLGREKVSRAMLGTYPTVFVTFEKRDGSVVSDLLRFGTEIMDALGVRLQEDQDVIGVRYAPPPDAPLKYPTVADGGWSQDFAVSKRTDSHGWTKPISSPKTEGWPEAVHQNRRADLIADRPSRYPG